MIKHLFKLIWNKKKENFLLISEILISFMVIFAVFTLLIYNYKNYNVPRGFEYENVWFVSFSSPEISKDKDSIEMVHQNLRNELAAIPQVKAMSFCFPNVPFFDSQYTTSVTYKGKEAYSDIYTVGESYKDVLQMKMAEGQWLSGKDKSAAYPSIVINQNAREKIIGAGPAIGNRLELNGKQYKIIGVVENIKDKGDYKGSTSGVYLLPDSGNIGDMNNILVHVSADADATFEGELYKRIATTMKSPNMEIKHLSELRIDRNKETIVPMVIFFIVAGFLIFNVALGLFGVLWYSISKRRGEIGLRRALGATAASVSGQLVGEAVILATFSLTIGSFFAIQFPLLNVFDLPAAVYLTAQLMAILFIYLLVILCALYPGKQAAAIYPAVALHEE